jgi:hypothetical protein
MAALNYWCKTCGGWRGLSHVHEKRPRALAIKRALFQERTAHGREIYRLVIEEKDAWSGLRALAIPPLAGAEVASVAVTASAAPIRKHRHRR